MKKWGAGRSGRKFDLLLNLGVALTVIVAIDAAACEGPIGRLVAAEGLVEVKGESAATWVAVKSGHLLCRSDRVAVRGDGRVAIVLDNEVMIRLDRNTTLTLTEVAADRDSQVGLVQGIVHVVSRFRKRFGISTPFVNAMVDGTEFTVASDTAKARVTVDEGRVRTLNDHGEKLVVAGEAAEAEAGMAPHGIVVRRLDAIAWAIHYPMVVWGDDAELSRLDEPLAATVRRVRALAVLARYGEALSLADAQQGRSDALAALRANLLLALGRSDEANEAGGTLVRAADAAALQAIVAMARNQTELALATAQRAVAADANSVAARMALSYALQGQRQLNQALAEAVHATELAPANPVAWARRAELELSMARLAAGRDSAGRALQLAPDMPRARAMLGIAQLLDRDASAALATLEAAVATDPADPLAHFGLGLVHVKQNDIERGRREIEIAVLLDPTNAELRSYLGRAYLEESRSSPAAAEFAVARRLDPASPTPWYFDAFRKLRDGDPLGAIVDGEEAIARNDNRAVLRPSELIDQDRAARSASIGAAYSEVGFKERMFSSAARALDDDPASPAAHRLLADAYAEEGRNETARMSELLQAQLHQPLGQWPVPAQYGVSQAPVLGGPRAVSPDDLSAFFDTRPERLAASGVAGDHGVRGNSLTVARTWDTMQVGFASFNYHSDGFRDNTDVALSAARLDILAATEGGGMVYAQYSRTRSETGDLAQRLFLETDPNLRRWLDIDVARVAFRQPLSATDEVLVETSYVDRIDRKRSVTTITIPPLVLDSDYRKSSRGRQLSLQYSGRFDANQLVTGVAANQTSQPDNVVATVSDPSGPGVPIVVSIPRSGSHNLAYAYLRLPITESWVAYGGLAYHRFQADGISSVNRVLGKVGLSFASSNGTVVRFASMQNVRGFISEEEGLEPTMFGGFNQVFDDFNGSLMTRTALRIEQHFGGVGHVGAELSQRRLSVPANGCLPSEACRTIWSDPTRQLFASTMLGQKAGISAAWQNESLYRNTAAIPNTAYRSVVDSIPSRTRTESLPLRLWFSPGAGFHGEFEVVRVRQEAVLNADEQKSSFRVANLRFKWRPVASPAYVLELAGFNLSDRRFRFQDTDFNDLPRTPMYYPARTVVVRLDVRF